MREDIFMQCSMPDDVLPRLQQSLILNKNNFQDSVSVA